MVQNIYKILIQNDSIPKEAKCFNNPRPKYVRGGKLF